MVSAEQREAAVQAQLATQKAEDAKRAETESKISEADTRFRSGPIHYQINLTENLGIGDQVTASAAKTQTLTENLAVQAQTAKVSPSISATTYQGIKKESAAAQAGIKQEITKSQQEIERLKQEKEQRRAELQKQIAYYSQESKRFDYSSNLQLESVMKEMSGLESSYQTKIQQQERNISALQTVSQKLSSAEQKAASVSLASLISQTPNYANPEYAKKGSPEYLGTSPKNLNQPEWHDTQKHIQEGVRTKLYSNPDFEKNHPLLQDREKTNTLYTVSLNEGGQPSGPKNYAVSLTEGAPNKPRTLTQEQVNRLSPQEYAVYQAEYAAYNQYVNQKNAEIKKENRLSLKGYQSNVLSIIENAKKEGATGLKITNEKGQVIETTPLSRAFYDISKLKGQNILVESIGKTEALPQKTPASQQPDYINNIRNELGLNTPIISAMEQKRMTMDEAVNAFVAPAKSLGMQVAALPEGFYREATQGAGKGQDWYKKEIEPKLPQTFFGAAVSGQPSGKSSAYQKTTILGEVALAAIPTLGAKLLERIRGVKAETPPRVAPKTEQPKIAPRTRIESAMIKESVKADTAIPLQQERVSLGRGIGKRIDENKPVFDNGVERKPPVKEDPFYKPELPKTRAKEPETYRIQKEKVFASDTGTPELVRTRVDLGAGTGKRITSPFRVTERIDLGEGKIILKKQTVSLGRGIGASPSMEDQINPKSISEDPYYQPSLPKTRAKKIGTYRIQKEKVFASDTKLAGVKEEKISLGRGLGRLVPKEGEKAPAFKTKPSPKPKPGEPKTGSRGQQLVMEKPTEAKHFKVTERINLGEGEAKLITTASSAAAAPIPLLVKAEDQGQSQAPITNQTQTNQTEAPIITDESQVSVLEPQSITQRRPSTIGAITTGGAIDLYQGVRPITRSQMGIGLKNEVQQKQKKNQPTILSYGEVKGLRQSRSERQRTTTPFPEPTRQPQKLAQPEAFKEREKLKLKIPEKIPKKPIQRFDVPFAEKKKGRIQHEKKEEKDRIEFIGNVLESDVGAAGFKGFDIKYGQKAVGKQTNIVLAITRKERKSFVTTKSGSSLAERGHYFTEKKPKPVSRSGFTKPGKFRL